MSEQQKPPSLIQDIFCRIPPMISTFIAIIILWLCAIYIHADTALNLVAIWWNDVTFYHCFFVLPIALYLIWRKRAELDRIMPQYDPIFLPLIIISGTATLLFQRIGVNLFSHLFFIFLLQSLMLVCLGRKAAKEIAFPIIFLLFMVPFGTELIVPLQNITAHISVSFLKLTAIDVTYEGIHIITNQARFYVAEACAGLRFLIANIFAMSLYAHIYFSSKRSWYIFIPLSIIIPIIGNCIRAYLIMVIGHYSHGELAAGIDHLIYGWGFFVLIAFLNFKAGEQLCLYEKRYGWDNYDSHKIDINRIYKPYDLEPIRTVFHKKYFAATIFALFAAVGMSFHLQRLDQKQLLKTDNIFQKVSPYTIKDNFLKLTEPDHLRRIGSFKGTSFYTDSYIDPDTKITYGTVYYPFQNADNEALNYNNKFHDEKNWLLLGKKNITIDNIPFIAELSGLLGYHKRITLYNYYNIDDADIQYETEPKYAKLNLLNMIISHGKTSGGIFYMQMTVPHHLSLKDAISLLLKKREKE